MKFWKAYVAYIKDNPNRYWFKRKLYGWGWTPATTEGWLVLLAALTVVIFLAWRAERLVLQGAAVFWQLLLPIALTMTALIGICFKTGESPRWQWHLPEKYFKD